MLTAEDFTLGLRLDIPRIPPQLDGIERYEAGPLLLTRGYRSLAEEQAAGIYTPEQMAVVEASNYAVDEGYSIHVLDRVSGREYLRFDLFDDVPHYHYLYDDHMRVVHYDVAANGPDVWAWLLKVLRGRLPDMLRFAGQDELAAAVDQAAIDAIIPALSAAHEASTRAPA
jgi:hypothetical protein